MLNKKTKQKHSQLILEQGGQQYHLLSNFLDGSSVRVIISLFV